MAKAWKLKPARKLIALDADEARRELADLAETAGEEGLKRLASALEAEGPVPDALGPVLQLSDFMRDSAKRYPQALDGLFDHDVASRLAAIDAEIAGLNRSDDLTEAGLMQALRRLKGEAHFLIALADLVGEATPEETVHRLSDLADRCTGASVDFLLREADSQGKIRLPDRNQPGGGSGWIILGMGKLGARELNFSSDIDLIVFFDPEAPAIIDPYESNDLFARLTRRLVRIMQDRTEHGYVFRTDLRLRPDPGSTPLAVPVGAALHYYESRGQNWERAAMIKARPIAGDIAAGEAVLKELRPYVWRKYLDYAAIADVHSIKRQIHAHKGHGKVAVKGHNVKLGRGGIREIEFFVQTQQLIAGGRFPELRGRETVAMLAEMARHGWISDEARDSLTQNYWYLRRVEHAIQVVADEQSHTLPDDDAGIEQIARLLGYASAKAFSTEFQAALGAVESHYAALFEAAPKLSSGVGNLVFTGDVDDPDTLQTLSRLGFERPSDITRIIRTWHFGRYRATQSAEARERLTELTPALLEALSQTKRADAAIVAFDAFIAGLPAGIQLFSLLQTNPALLKMIATIMGAAPRLAEIITRRPHVFDGLLDPALMSDLPDRAYLAQRLHALLEGTTIHEVALDRLRVFAAEQKFLIGVRLLAGSIDAARAGKAFSDLADLTIAAALEAVIAEFEKRHGKVKGGKVAILGLGKLGSRELTAGSDVDLILLYDHDTDAEESDGEKPMAPSQYYMRMTQRLIAAVSAPTAEGVLYELDLRLRPSGNKGPVATHIESFRKYQENEAWTWEHMAMTRARTVAGDAGFLTEVDSEIAAIVSRQRDAAKMFADALEMRKVIEAEKPAKDLWDIKLAKGGLIDLEFIAQVAALTDKIALNPRRAGTAENLAALKPDFVDAPSRDELSAALALYQTLTQIIRLCLTENFDRKDAPPGLIDLLLRATDLPEMNVLEAHLKETEQAVRRQFSVLMKQ